MISFSLLEKIIFVCQYILRMSNAKVSKFKFTLLNPPQEGRKAAFNRVNAKAQKA